MIHRLSDMIGSKNTGARMADGRYVRAVPLPWNYRSKWNPREAWAVLWGRAHAVRWPEHGELEKALEQ